MSVSKYLNKITQLSRYAPKDIAIDNAQQKWFKRGLNPSLKVQVVSNGSVDFQHMVDKAMFIEESRRALEESSKRKMVQHGPHQNQCATAYLFHPSCRLQGSCIGTSPSSLRIPQLQHQQQQSNLRSHLFQLPRDMSLCPQLPMKASPNANSFQLGSYTSCTIPILVFLKFSK